MVDQHWDYLQLLYSASSYSCHLKSRSRTHFFPLVAINENNWDKKYIDRFRVYYILRLFEKITLCFQFPKISVIRGLLVYIIKWLVQNLIEASKTASVLAFQNVLYFVSFNPCQSVMATTNNSYTPSPWLPWKCSESLFRCTMVG